MVWLCALGVALWAFPNVVLAASASTNLEASFLWQRPSRRVKKRVALLDVRPKDAALVTSAMRDQVVPHDSQVPMRPTEAGKREAEANKREMEAELEEAKRAAYPHETPGFHRASASAVTLVIVVVFMGIFVTLVVIVVIACARARMEHNMDGAPQSSVQ